jgi:hypothetical protein
MEMKFDHEKRTQRRYEQIGTSTPRCPDCPEADWRCFTATSMPRCVNCAIKATKPDNDVAKRRRLKELGTDNPHCAMCGESDWRCIEQHHVCRRKHDAMTVLLCANDHLRVTDDQKDHPSSSEAADPLLVQISNFLRGLADMLRVVADRLIEFADALLHRVETPQASSTQRRVL